MEYFGFITFRRVFVSVTFLCILCFFVLLVMVNNTNRQGIAEYAKLVDETRDYERKTKEMEIEIASYSALTRIEQRAKELGLEKAKRVEYLR